MKLPRAATLPLTAILLLLAGLLGVGCSSKSGHAVGPNQAANLEVQNDQVRTLHVLIDGAEIGDVGPGSLGRFFVSSGYRDLSFRERGDSTPQYYGRFLFEASGSIKITYNPGSTFNLRFRNDVSSTVNVQADFVDVGDVPPNSTALMTVSPGTHDIYVRERGSNTSRYLVTLTFTTSSVVEARYP